MAAIDGPVLVIQDMVIFSYGQHPETRDPGPIGTSNSAHEGALIMHNALAFTAAGVPLGLLSQNLWARQAAPEEDYQEKIISRQPPFSNGCIANQCYSQYARNQSNGYPR
jgi:hypothetical protein